MDQGEGNRFCLGDGDVVAEVDVLDGLEDFGAFVDGTLEGFSSGDEAGAAGSFVDDGGEDGVLEVVVAGGAAGVDEAGSAHVAVGDLVAAEVDRMVGGEFAVDALIEFAVAGSAGVEGFEAAVVFGEFLLDDVGLDGDAEVVGLAGEVGGEVVVLVLLEGVVAEVAPEHGGHAEFVGAVEGFGDFDDLAAGVIRAEVYGCPDRDGTHVPGLFDLGEHDLVGLVGVGQEFVVVDLDHEGDLVGVLAANHAKDAEGGTDGVASAFDGELDNVFGVEVGGVFGKGRTTGVLDALVDGEDAEVAGAGEATVVVHGFERAQGWIVAVAVRHHAVDKVSARQVQLGLVHGFAFVVEEAFCAVSEDVGDL